MSTNTDDTAGPKAHGDALPPPRFLETFPPFDGLPPAAQAELAPEIEVLELGPQEQVYGAGDRLQGLYAIANGKVEIRSGSGDLVSILTTGTAFGERGLMRGGTAVTSARTLEPTLIYLIPAATFHRLVETHDICARFFGPARAVAEPAGKDLTTVSIADLMAKSPLTCARNATLSEVAQTMRARNLSSILVTEGDRLKGIVTTGDLTYRALAAGLPGDTPVAEVMTADPVALAPTALGADVLHEMLERGIGHMPVVEKGRLVGIVTQTDLTRFQAVTSAILIREVVAAPDAQALARIVARIPELLVHLVGAGNRHEVTTRLLTDIGDAATRRLLKLAEETLGPPPVPYLWLACGSQGRQEQTGVSDQDNCLILDDQATPEHDAYFAALAKFVSDGLDVCGYFYCPGDMMATNPRWRQPVRVWREYFTGWVRKPDPMAQMLASVMFDLRPIGGATHLFHDLMAETLALAAANSIFVAHMVSNSLKHTPPLGLFRSFATIRSGEHKDTVDLKHNGVVPVVDLGRIYAIQAKLEVANTRARLVAAEDTGVVSASGARDLLDAYDLIAETRLEHQARRVRAGAKPDNFMAPGTLSDLERNHLRDAFVVVKTMQSALGYGRASLG